MNKLLYFLFMICGIALATVECDGSHTTASNEVKSENSASKDVSQPKSKYTRPYREGGNWSKDDFEPISLGSGHRIKADGTHVSHSSHAAHISSLK